MDIIRKQQIHKNAEAFPVASSGRDDRLDLLFELAKEEKNVKELDEALTISCADTDYFEHKLVETEAKLLAFKKFVDELYKALILFKV